MSGTAGPTTTDRPAPPPWEPDPARTPWYRRRAFLVGAGVVVVVAVAVLSDLPTPTSRVADIAAESAVIAEINTDVGPCVFSVHEALTLYADESGRLSAADRSQIPGLLRDDQNACSYTSAGIFDLSDIDVLGTPAGKQVAQAVNTATVWSTSDALAAIEAVQSLTADPVDKKARTMLEGDEKLLAADRAKATSEIDDAGRLLATRLPALDISTQVLPGVPAS